MLEPDEDFAKQPLSLGHWRVDPMTREITDGFRSCRLTSKAIGFLMMLVEVKGELVTYDALQRALWNGVTTSRGNLSQVATELRHAFRDRQIVINVSGEGYRLNVQAYALALDLENRFDLQAYQYWLQAQRLRDFNGIASFYLGAQAIRYAPSCALSHALYATGIVDFRHYCSDDGPSLNEAVEAGRTAARLGKPDESIGHASLAYALSAIDKHTDACCIFEKALARNAQDFDTNYLFARALFALGDYRGAALLAEHAATLNLIDCNAPFVAMGAFAKSGQIERANVASKHFLMRVQQRFGGGPVDPAATRIEKSIRYLIGRKACLPVLACVGGSREISFSL